MLKKGLFAVTLALITSQVGHAAIVISQYYEGTSNNKWIELYNTDTENAVNLGTLGLRIGLWTNAAAEGYKSDTAPNANTMLTGTIQPGGYYLLGNTSAVIPSYVVADASNTTSINFNGNDSIALFTGTTFSTANIIDAIGFTNSGNEGVDKSFVRIDVNTPGWDTTLGSDVLDFSTVWQTFTLEAVANASVGSPERLVSSAASPAPEPSTAITLLGGLGVLCGFRRMRGDSRNKTLIR